MEERPSWIQSVTNQFHFSLGGKVIGPTWFFLLSMGFMIFLSAQDKTWRTTGVLMLLSAFSPMVQETRRHHGAPLPKTGWWTLLQNLIVMVSGAILAVDGAMMGWKNVKFAIGIIIFIVFLGFFLFRYVLYMDEKRKR